MTPEEQLDRLIERWEKGASPGPVPPDELSARLFAVRALARLQEIPVPPAFAARLETRLRARDLAQQHGRARGRHQAAVGRLRLLRRHAHAAGRLR